MANPLWTRWIHASVGKFLADVADDNSIPYLIEGIDERSDEFSEAQDRVEIRVNGPFSRELTRGTYRLDVDINVLIISTYGGTTKDAYRLDVLLGIFHNAMDGAIPIFKYGTDPEGDEEQIGCLTLKSGKNSRLNVMRFGQLATDVKLQEGMVDGKYTMTISE